MKDELERCPKCNSENYGYDLDESGREHWSCLDCKLGIEPDDYRADKTIPEYDDDSPPLNDWEDREDFYEQ